MKFQDYRTVFQVSSLALVLLAASPALSLIVSFPRGGERFSELSDEVDLVLGPRQRRHVALTEHLHVLSVHDHVLIFTEHYGAAEAPVHGVVPKQGRERVGVREVVHRHHLEPLIPLEDTEYEPPYSSKPIDRHSDRHNFLPPKSLAGNAL